QATPMPKGKGRERAQGEEQPSSARAEASDDVHDTLRIIMEQLREQNKQIQQMKDRDTQRHSPGYREEPESSYSRSPRRREHSRSPRRYNETRHKDDRITMELKNFRREAKMALPDKPRVVLRTDNYTAWKENTLAEAGLIDAKDILREEQTSPASWFDELERVLWKERSRILYTRISASLHHTVRKVAD